MDKSTHFHLLTFVTKYSRVPEEEVNRDRYNAVMDMGADPVIIKPEWYKTIIDAFIEQAKKLWICILACNIIPDHVHIVIDSYGKKIPDIVKRLKWCSGYMYNYLFNRTWALRARWYNATSLNNKKYLLNTIQYVENNHLKHQEKWWNIRNSSEELKVFSIEMKKNSHIKISGLMDRKVCWVY